MPTLLSLFRGSRTPAAPQTTDEAQPETPKVQVFLPAGAEGMYVRDPNGTLKMDPATAEAYVAAMSG